MIYEEFPIPASIQSFVLCYWKFEGPKTSAQTPTRHFIAPDACASLVFIDNKHLSFRSTALFGPTKYISETDVFPHSSAVGIRFKPGLTSALFNQTGKELRDQNILPAPELEGLDYKIALQRLENIPALFDYFEKTLPEVRQLHPGRPHDMVEEAIKRILQSKGNLRIADLIRDIPLSERQLQKVFKKEVGLSLKEFSTTMRLRSAIIKMEVEEASYQDTVFESGYYDQAHFIRDFSKVSRISLPDFKKYIKNIRHVNVGFWQ